MLLDCTQVTKMDLLTYVSVVILGLVGRPPICRRRKRQQQVLSPKKTMRLQCLARICERRCSVCRRIHVGWLPVTVSFTDFVIAGFGYRELRGEEGGATFL